jgi:hypothetical protein
MPKDILPAQEDTMLPQFLLPETTVRAAGQSSEIDLGVTQEGTLVLTLGITRIIEQESIDLSIWGSDNGTDWGLKPLAAFPQKFYCGTYQILLDLQERPVRYLRAKWQVNRWGKGDPKPLFAIYLFAQVLDRELALHA